MSYYFAIRSMGALLVAISILDVALCVTTNPAVCSSANDCIMIPSLDFPNYDTLNRFGGSIASCKAATGVICYGCNSDGNCKYDLPIVTSVKDTVLYPKLSTTVTFYLPRIPAQSRKYFLRLPAYKLLFSGVSKYVPYIGYELLACSQLCATSDECVLFVHNGVGNSDCFLLEQPDLWQQDSYEWKKINTNTFLPVIACPPSSYLIPGTNICEDLSDALFQQRFSGFIGGNGNKQQPCPVGQYTSSSTQCSPCAPGYYRSQIGGESCRICPKGSYSSVSGATACTLCPKAQYTDTEGSTRCQSCLSGQYSSTEGASTCTDVEAGCYGLVASAISCPQVCIEGFYSTAGSTQCSHCGTNVAVSGFWSGVGVPSRDLCRCAVGYTGENCDFPACSPYLSGGSLVSLLFKSNTKLGVFTATYSPNIVLAATQYLEVFLGGDVDRDGNGIIDRLEVVEALKYRSVFVNSTIGLPLWVDVKKVYQTQIYIADLLIDATKNYVTSIKHTFDGSGVSVATNLVSTAPMPKWSNSECAQYDKYLHPAVNVTTTWSWTLPNYQSKVSRVCGYTNGVLEPIFNRDMTLSGEVTQYVDSQSTTTAKLTERRIYCIAVDDYNTASTSFECSAGLYYVSS